MLKIILLGYMGSGKTSIGVLLANKLNLNFIDLDNFIEIEEESSVSDIFSSKGEIYFRKKEAYYFREILNDQNSFVLSLGGGTPCYANNHLLLGADNVVSIYLKASIETLSDRLQNEKSHRPLLSEISNEDLSEHIAKNIFDRSFFYHQAKYTISVDGKQPAEIVSDILNILA